MSGMSTFSIRIQHLLGVSMITTNHNLVSGFPGRVNNLAKTPVHGLDSRQGGLHFAGMANHIGIGVIYYNKGINFFFKGSLNRLRYSAGAHFRF